MCTVRGAGRVRGAPQPLRDADDDGDGRARADGDDDAKRGGVRVSREVWMISMVGASMVEEARARRPLEMDSGAAVCVDRVGAAKACQGCTQRFLRKEKESFAHNTHVV